MTSVQTDNQSEREQRADDFVGTVIRTEGPEYVVARDLRQLDDASEASPEVVQCVLVGRRLRHRPVVGDRVHVRRVADDGRILEDHCLIDGVEPRTNLLERARQNRRRGSRPLVANLDQLVVVASAQQPPLRPGLIDRYIAAAEQQGMTPLLCFNKWDLADDDDDAVQRVYADLGYPSVRTSAITGEGVERLLELLRGHQSAFVGHSGVGKTSLMQCIYPDHDFEVRAVNAHTGRGRHTTTHASLLPLPDGHGPGFVVDTPGIREFGLVGIEPDELATLYVDFGDAAQSCRFSPCTHTHEPRCGVKDAVEAGEIAAVRYEGYCRLYEELRAHWEARYA